jgi:hypothetical protein
VAVVGFETHQAARPRQSGQLGKLVADRGGERHGDRPILSNARIKDTDSGE